MGALPAADAMLDPAGSERGSRAIGFIARVEGELRELHHGSRTHEQLAVRGTGRNAQHALDAVHGVGRRRELGPGDRFGKAVVGPLALYPWLERLDVGEVPRSVDHEVSNDRKSPPSGRTIISGSTGSQHPSVWRPLTMTPHMPHFLTPQNHW